MNNSSLDYLVRFFHQRLYTLLLPTASYIRHQHLQHKQQRGFPPSTLTDTERARGKAILDSTLAEPVDVAKATEADIGKQSEALIIPLNEITKDISKRCDLVSDQKGQSFKLGGDFIPSQFKFVVKIQVVAPLKNEKEITDMQEALDLKAETFRTECAKTHREIHMITLKYSRAELIRSILHGMKKLAVPLITAYLHTDITAEDRTKLDDLSSVPNLADMVVALVTDRSEKEFRTLLALDEQKTSELLKEILNDETKSLPRHGVATGSDDEYSLTTVGGIDLETTAWPFMGVEKKITEPMALAVKTLIDQFVFMYQATRITTRIRKFALTEAKASSVAAGIISTTASTSAAVRRTTGNAEDIEGLASTAVAKASKQVKWKTAKNGKGGQNSNGKPKPKKAGTSPKGLTQQRKHLQHQLLMLEQQETAGRKRLENATDHEAKRNVKGNGGNATANTKKRKHNKKNQKEKRSNNGN